MNDTLELPARLDSGAAQALAARLMTLRGGPVTLDAGAVGFCGALGLQVLVAAERQWREDGVSFRVTGAGQGLTGACATLGIGVAAIGAGAEGEAQT